MQRWSYRINGGPESVIETETTIYQRAAAAVMAYVTDQEVYAGAIIEIWTEFGSFFYKPDEDEYGRFVLTQVVWLREAAIK